MLDLRSISVEREEAVGMVPGHANTIGSGDTTLNDCTEGRKKKHRRRSILD
jgi:hypothetical protein